MSEDQKPCIYPITNWAYIRGGHRVKFVSRSGDESVTGTVLGTTSVGERNVEVYTDRFSFIDEEWFAFSDTPLGICPSGDNLVVFNELVETFHRAFYYNYDDCDHGMYTGGVNDGKPYSMCERFASLVFEKFTVSTPEQP